tara:strand:+ start:2141 stop:4120 length:1980 start_codon:yes stop_codon:yes gene_type:complete
MDNPLSKLLEFYKSRNFIRAEKEYLNIAKKVKPNHELLNLFGVILYELKKYDQAVIQIKKSIEINPNYYQGYNSLGNILFKKNDFDEALKAYQKAIDLKFDYHETYHNIGNVYLKLKQIDKAIENYNLALKFNPNYVPAIKSKVNIHFNLKNHKLALEEIQNFLRVEPNNASIYHQRGHVFSEINNLDLALQSYEKARILNPDKPFLLGSIQLTKNKMCIWSDFFEIRKQIEDKIKKHEKVSPPYLMTTIFDSPKIQFECAKIWQNEYKLKYNKNLSFSFKKKTSKKIKLGFFSADFRVHAMGHLMVGMLERHDKSQFELYGFYFGPKIKSNDTLHNRIFKCFDKFIDISSMTDLEALNLCRELEIDIAIDFMCHTGDYNRFSLFLKRLAPIQINFLGYPGTSGSNSLDYIVADKILIEPDEQKYYSEKIIYLPDTYQPNENNKKISNTSVKKEFFSLPENKFIFCCFNNHLKINPIIFEAWLYILKNTKNSVLWLLKDNDFSQNNLKSLIEKNGIDPNRLIFAKNLKIEDHLQRIKFADLFLDTFPYNAHTTCSDALRAGIPVLTLKGNSFASRVAASLLNTINLNELIATNIEDYKELAIKIYNEKSYLDEIKKKIAINKKNSNLFKAEIYTKNIERAYKIVHQNYVDGIKPKNLVL